MRNLRSTLILFCIIFSAIASVHAAGSDGQELQTVSVSSKSKYIKASQGAYASNGSKKSAPLSFQLYCLKSPDQCRGGGGKKTIRLTDSSRKHLAAVNREINRKIRPRRDGKVDVWSDAVTSGDCEDYALAKRRRLIDMGYPTSALRIAVAKTGSGEGHAVLVVKTDKGDRILDNRNNAIRPWNQTDLRMISMSSSNPLRWN